MKKTTSTSKRNAGARSTRATGSALSELRDIVAMRATIWRERQDDPRALSVIGATRNETKFAYIGRQHEAQAVLAMIDDIVNKRTLDWARPETPNTKITNSDPKETP